MKALSFSFKPTASSRELEEALELIQRLNGVEGASLVRPHAKNPSIRHMATLSLSNAADIPTVLACLNKLPCVAQASIPPVRKMAA